MRWADLDMLGHVNNVTYVDYLQEARVDMLRTHGSRPRGDAGDLAEGVVVVRHEVTYLRPLMFTFEPVQIECWVTEIRPATFTMAYEVFHDDGDEGRVVYLRAKTVLSPYVFRGEHPRRLTEDEKVALADFLEPEARPRPDRFTVVREESGHYPVHVRFSDVDVYGHVNNVKYFEYLQEARIAMLSELVPVRRFSVVVAQTDVDYLQPLLFRAEPYDCRSTITRVGTRSMTVESELRDASTHRVLARARVVVVFFDLATNRSAEPDPELREALLARAVTA